MTKITNYVITLTYDYIQQTSGFIDWLLIIHKLTRFWPWLYVTVWWIMMIMVISILINQQKYVISSYILTSINSVTRILIPLKKYYSVHIADGMIHRYWRFECNAQSDHPCATLVRTMVILPEGFRQCPLPPSAQ